MFIVCKWIVLFFKHVLWTAKANPADRWAVPPFIPAAFFGPSWEEHSILDVNAPEN